jgi:hypothetical protein
MQLSSICQVNKTDRWKLATKPIIIILYCISHRLFMPAAALVVKDNHCISIIHSMMWFHWILNECVMSWLMMVFSAITEFDHLRNRLGVAKTHQTLKVKETYILSFWFSCSFLRHNWWRKLGWCHLDMKAQGPFVAIRGLIGDGNRWHAGVAGVS